MSDDSFSWSDILDWFVFLRSPALRRDVPPLESHDGEEPTAEALRERARQIDAKGPATAINKPSSTKKADTLDKEFWDTQI
jgi:hypothetical protein